MASISSDANETKRVQFTDVDGERRAGRLGKNSVKAADSIRVRIETLKSNRDFGRAHDNELSAWLSERPDVIYQRLFRANLAKPRIRTEVVALKRLLDSFFDASDVKPASLVRMR